MIVFPAIDLRRGKCVRLIQGEPGAETVYGDDPVAIAQRWVAAGCQWLHVVNLDGAFAGSLQPGHANRSVTGGGAVGAARPSRPFLDDVDLVGDQAVRLAVDGVGGLRVRGVDEAEDLPRRLVDPVPEVLDPVSALRGEVGGVRLGDVVDADPALDRVDIHEQRHGGLLGRCG